MPEDPQPPWQVGTERACTPSGILSPRTHHQPLLSGKTPWGLQGLQAGSAGLGEIAHPGRPGSRQGLLHTRQLVHFPNGFQTWRNQRATQDCDVLLHARLTCRVSDRPTPRQYLSAVGGPASCFPCSLLPIFRAPRSEPRTFLTAEGRGVRRKQCRASVLSCLPASEGSKTALPLPQLLSVEVEFFRGLGKKT